jgi:hypothetical protein
LGYDCATRKADHAQPLLCQSAIIGQRAGFKPCPLVFIRGRALGRLAVRMLGTASPVKIYHLTPSDCSAALYALPWILRDHCLHGIFVFV